jgi:hypothetical protein
VGLRAILDAVVKRKIPSPRRESNPRTPIVQPLGSFENEGREIESVEFYVKFFPGNVHKLAPDTIFTIRCSCHRAYGTSYCEYFA